MFGKINREKISLTTDITQKSKIDFCKDPKEKSVWYVLVQTVSTKNRGLWRFLDGYIPDLDKSV